MDEYLFQGHEQEMRRLRAMEHLYDPGTLDLLARVGVATTLEEIEPLSQPLEDLLHGEHAGAGGGEFERKRHVVQPAAQLLDGGRPLGPRALTEEPCRFLGIQRPKRIFAFAGHPQQLPARDDDRQVRAATE